LRQRRVRAADRDERADREDREQCEVEAGALVVHRFSHHASATLSGMMTAITHSSGQRRTPTATKVTAATRCAGLTRSFTVEPNICTALAIRSPAAAAASPANTPRSTG